MIEQPLDALIDSEERLAIRRHRGPGSEARRWLLTIFVTVLLAVGLLAGSLVVAIYMAARSNQERGVDAIVVMGAAQFDGRPSDVLRARLDTTLSVWEEGVAPVIIVTGGKMPGDRFTESESSRNYLVDHGVPEESILLENEGRTTEVSLARTARIARDHGFKRVLIVTDGFHLFRSKLIAERNGLDAFGVPVSEGPINPWSTLELRYIARESAAVIAYLFG